MTSRSTKLLLPIFLIVLVDIFGLAMVLPLLPLYAERLGATPGEIGALISIYALAQFFAGPFLGRLSDRIGRKPVLLISQIGTFFGFILLAFGRSYWLIFISRLIDGATAGNITVAQAYISDRTTAADRTKAFGYLGAAFGLGFFVGPALAGVLAEWNILFPVFVACGLSGLSIAATSLMLEGRTHAHEVNADRAAAGVEGIRSLFRHPKLTRLLLVCFLFSYAFSTFISGLALFVERRLQTGDGHPFGSRETGLLFAYLGLVAISIQGFALGRILKRVSEFHLVVGGLALMCVGFSMMFFDTHLAVFICAFSLAAIGICVVRPCLESIATHMVSNRERGTVLGMTQSLYSVAQVVSPLVGGFMIERGALSAWAALCALVSFVGGSMAVVAIANSKPQSHL